MAISEKISREIRPKSLGEREDELSVRQGKEQLLVEVLREEKGPLLAAGRAEVETPTREGAEVLQAAFWV